MSSTKLISLKEIKNLYESLQTVLQHKKPLATFVGLVQFHPPIVERKDSIGRLLLHWDCCYKPSLDVVKFLMPKMTQDPVMPDNLVYSPLHCACLFGASLEVIQYLLLQQPVATLVFNSHSKLPLDYAKQKKLPATVIEAIKQTMRETVSTIVSNKDHPSIHIKWEVKSVMQFESDKHSIELNNKEVDFNSVLALVRQPDVQAFLKEEKNRKLILDLLTVNRAEQTLKKLFDCCRRDIFQLKTKHGVKPSNKVIVV